LISRADKLLRLVSPLALISWPVGDHMLVDVALSASLKSTLGLKNGKSVGAQSVFTVSHTGVPQGLVGMLLPFPLPRPPPCG